MSENLIWWNKKPGLFAKKIGCVKIKQPKAFSFRVLGFDLSLGLCNAHWLFPLLQCASFLNAIQNEDTIIFRFSYCFYSSLYMVLVDLQNDEDDEGDLFLYKEIS